MKKMSWVRTKWLYELILDDFLAQGGGLKMEEMSFLQKKLSPSLYRRQFALIYHPILVHRNFNN